MLSNLDHASPSITRRRTLTLTKTPFLRRRDRYPDFSVRNITANGRIVDKEGRIIDLYEDRKKLNPKKLNENGMSLGMIFRYGDFSFYTAGDFSDKWKNADGSLHYIEDDLAAVCPRVNVAKINHHGHHSMPPKLVAALRAQVYISCVWDQLHNTADTMEHIADRSLYPEDRIVCPGIMPEKRRREDAGSEWLKDVAEASYEGGHVILDVPQGGKNFTVTYLTAADESMLVRSVLHFDTRVE